MALPSSPALLPAPPARPAGPPRRVESRRALAQGPRLFPGAHRWRRGFRYLGNKSPATPERRSATPGRPRRIRCKPPGHPPAATGNALVPAPIVLLRILPFQFAGFAIGRQLDPIVLRQPGPPEPHGLCHGRAVSSIWPGPLRASAHQVVPGEARLSGSRDLTVWICYGSPAPRARRSEAAGRGRSCNTCGGAPEARRQPGRNPPQ